MQHRQRIPRETHDVVVIGSGAAGLTVAIAAREAGVNVTVLEKAPDIKRTNTSRAGGTIWTLNRDLPQSVDDRIKQAVELTRGNCNVPLLKAVLESYDDTVDWLEKVVGLKRDKKPNLAATSKGSIKILGFGAGLNKQLLYISQKMGCQIRFNTKVVKLLTDEKGSVVGVRAKTSEGLRDFEALAVVLATAGFQGNQEMLMKYFGSEVAYGVKLTGSPYATGDGHIMAQEIGAKLTNMDQWHCRTVDKSWTPGWGGKPGPMRNLQQIYRYFIFVNKLGRRFMDEAPTDNISPSNATACAIAKQPDMAVAFVFDEKIRALNPKAIDGYKPPGIVMKCNTLEELASKIEVPSDELKRTITEFNNAVEAGETAKLGVPKSSFAVKIDTPPFYAVYPVWSGLNCTMGGVNVTDQAQIIDRDDMPIPGLYAAGEMVSGLFWGRYYTTREGATYYKANYQVTSDWLACCLSLGAIAGRSAAKLALQEGYKRGK